MILNQKNHLIIPNYLDKAHPKIEKNNHNPYSYHKTHNIKIHII